MTNNTMLGMGVALMGFTIGTIKGVYQKKQGVRTYIIQLGFKILK